MFSLREYREPTNRLADRLPWAALVAPGVVLQKDGLLQKTVTFRGPDLGSSSPHELVYTHDQLNHALMRLGSGWALFVETQRRRSNPYPQARWNHAAAWVVDLERARTFGASAHYQSEYYLTFVWQPPSAVPGDAWNRMGSFFFADAGGAQGAADPNRENRQLAREVAAFRDSVDSIVRLLKIIFAQVQELDDEATLTYLHSAVSTNRHRVRVPDVPMYLDALVADETFAPGEQPKLGKHYIPTCTVVDFPSSLEPGVLDALNYLQCEYRLVTRWIALDKNDAQRALESYQLRWLQAQKKIRTMVSEHVNKQESRRVNFGAADKATNVETAMRSLAADVEAFGYLTTTVTVWDTVYARAREKLKLVEQAIQGAGFTVHEETDNVRQAWLGSLPGNVYANVRRPLLSTRNLVRLLPTNAPWTGAEHNAHLEKVSGVGLPHMVCMTSGATPFHLNLNVKDIGHTLILGRTGAGKSTLLAVLALQWPKYPGARVVIFDKDRSARAATLAMEGAIFEPGNEAAPVSFQPLRDITDRSERTWASQFVLSLFAAQGVAATPAMNEHVEAALDSLVSHCPEDRRISTLSHLLSSFDPAYALALQPYCGRGSFAQIFDGSHDDLRTSHWTLVEMGHLMGLGPAAILPALLYLFHRFDQQFTGEPTLVVLDEAWLFLGHPIFAQYLQVWLKTLRKKNVFIVFATQEVADATRNPLLHSTILSACSTTIFLADPKAQELAQQYRELGLSSTEIRTLTTMAQKRDYYYRSEAGRRVFSLSLGPAQLAFAGMSSADDQKVIDRIVATRPSSEVVEALLEHGGVEWAVEAIRRQRSSEPASPLIGKSRHAEAAA